jgi:IS5 family transposase
MIGLQVLKAYLNLSDDKLRQRLNTEWALQYFCGIHLGPGQKINDRGILGRA